MGKIRCGVPACGTPLFQDEDAKTANLPSADRKRGTQTIMDSARALQLQPTHRIRPYIDKAKTNGLKSNLG